MGRYKPPQPQSSKYITPEGAAALEKELQFLWRRKRPEITLVVAEAAAQGDRSENADYIYGKKQLGEIDRRIRYLRKRLESINVINTTPSNQEKVYFGAWFTLSDNQDQIRKYRLVGPDEFDFKEENISMDSPLGIAVMGKSLNEKINVKTPEGKTSFTLIAISYKKG
ncbi:MAG: transcription elongation factor GreB [Rhodospirillaceae bacterium]|nr:transcription elongation factor GreB [Rhodospirillaceae bacterium]